MTDKTLADHAELWAKENGMSIPERNTLAWTMMYGEWIQFAFQGFADIDSTRKEQTNTVFEGEPE